ncbi:MAG: hypothetical protein IKT67_05440 [Lachnospiraceae bacterium]|nr:hypothetical protein [Lachnospiraceae bacterium]
MECPYCKQEMKKGCLKGDGRQKVRWQEEGKKNSLGDKLAGAGLPEAVKYSLGAFQLPGEFCKSCKKLIIDTGITE